jgi:hypothetical protein
MCRRAHDKQLERFKRAKTIVIYLVCPWLVVYEKMAVEAGEASPTDTEAEMQECSSDSMSELSSEDGNETPISRRAKERRAALKVARQVASRPQPLWQAVVRGKDLVGHSQAKKQN